ncbi:MAG TPA: hypothetical protein VIV61_04645, partial [Candidatus Ozemobacteraceae bacterium]
MKNLTSRVLLGMALLLSLAGSPAAFAVASDSYNGIAYIFLPPADADPGYVIRLRHTSADGVVTPQAELYYPDNTYFGLAVSQERDIFMLQAPVMTGDTGWTPAPVGYQPSASDYPTDSDIYLKLISPSSYSPWRNVHGTGYWKQNYTINGTSYAWAMVAGGPTSVRYLNPSGSGALGTPLWDGIAGSPHPTDASKRILPSHWGGMAYYAYGTSQHPDYPWKQLDGREDPAGSGRFRPTVLATQVPTYHGSDNQKFSCIVKRVYETRDRSLKLMKGSDAPFTPLQAQSGAVLSATDVRGTEYYARGCGDNCIPGGSGPGVAIESVLANVKVVTSTLGRRYGFNQKGLMSGPYADPKQAALRVASTSGERTIDMANSDGTVHSNIKNAAYLNAHNIKANEIKSFGISSNFDPAATMDFIYASKADLFVVQDSWWGTGGIGYEYYKDTGEIYKLDYTNNTNPTAEYLGIVSGDVDDIGVDGDGFLYIMTSEAELSDAQIAALAPSMATILGSSDYSVAPAPTKWYRPRYEMTPLVVEDAAKTAGDYRDITYYQSFSKKVNKYPPSAGGGNLAAPTLAGQVSGYYKDLWTRKIEWNGSTANLVGNWSQEPKASRDSIIDGELAVINVAKLPAVFNENPGNPKICREDRQPFSTLVSEDSSVLLKVEGFKPYISDLSGTTRRDLKPMGSFGTYANVRLNNLPTTSGSYNHDEDGDGSFSGFPTSLFEADGLPTTITWYADLVDGTTPESPVISSIAVASASNVDFSGRTCDWSFTPPHPGNYAVWAKITYNYFNFAGVDRPTNLTSGQRTATSEKRVLRVVSSTSLNGPPSLISSIQLDPARGDAATAFQNCTPVSNAGYDLPEDEAVENLKISFKAQFLRDANYRTSQSSRLTTYDGMGVWDYDTYYGLYSAAGETPSYARTSSHVYNYQADGSGYAVSSAFNPGWPKTNAVADVTAANQGTRTDMVTPSANDLKFLRWNLWLENTCTGANIAGQTPPWRGVKLASGDCTGAQVTPTSNPGEYQITLSLPSSAQGTQRIATPLDPDQYKVRLELIYPRVSWRESSVDEDATKKQYRSIIPDAVPVSAICEKTHPTLPTSDTAIGGGSAFANSSVKAWLIRARDKTPPTHTDLSRSILHTTGDPVPEVTASFTVSDNNPRATFGTFEVLYQMANTALPRDPTSLSVKQAATTHTEIGKKPDFPEFWQRDDYRIGATYTAQIADYGPSGPFAPTGALANWVGVLSYNASGSLNDGFGVDGQNTTHLFGSFTTPLPAGAVNTTQRALERFDNDPPGFRVEIISQNDNRRWVATLTEGVQDAVPVPTTEADLAKSLLEVSCFHLNGTPIGGGATTAEINGCTQYPTAIGTANEA